MKQEAQYPRWSARLGVRLSAQEVDRLDKFCDLVQTDRSATIRQALKEYLDDQPILRDKQA